MNLKKGKLPLKEAFNLSVKDGWKISSFKTRLGFFVGCWFTFLLSGMAFDVSKLFGIVWGIIYLPLFVLYNTYNLAKDLRKHKTYKE